MLKTLITTRYLTALREGSSVPAIVEADDGELYVMKFAGAGQGPKALIAELVAGEIGRLLGLRVPEIALIELDPSLPPLEPHPEIADILVKSVGLNLGLRYLTQAFAYNPLLEPPPDPDLASDIVWFDAYVTNLDRTPRNVNLLLWQRELWLIDHGASLYFHHNWNGYRERSRSPFPQIKDHCLLAFAGELEAADARAHARLSAAALDQVVAMIPDQWLDGEPLFDSLDEHRRAYVDFLVGRLAASTVFVQEAQRARAQLL